MGVSLKKMCKRRQSDLVYTEPIWIGRLKVKIMKNGRVDPRASVDTRLSGVGDIRDRLTLRRACS